MKIKLGPANYAYYKVEEHRQLVTACFYLGYGPTRIRAIVLHRDEARDELIIKTAIALGMSGDDDVQLDPSVQP